jgi:hypothetical protein
VRFKKQSALVFIVPQSGVYHLQASATSNPWGGTKANAYVYVMKRDGQRVGEIKKFALKADASAVTIDVEVEAAVGHELLFLTEMPDFNASTTITLTDISVTKQ